MAKLSALDIKKQDFKRVLRGFDTEEVQVFLEMVSEQYAALQDENTEMKQQLIQVESKLEEYQKNEKNINEILSRAREMQEETTQNIRKQEEIILKEAEFKAVEILENARKEVRQIREEIVSLQHRKDSFVSRLKFLIQSYMDLIKMLDVENVIEEDIEEKPVRVAPGLRRGKRKTGKHQTEEDNHEITGENLGNKQSEKTKGTDLIHEDDIIIEDISELVDKIDPQNSDSSGEDETENNKLFNISQED